MPRSSLYASRPQGLTISVMARLKPCMQRRLAKAALLSLILPATALAAPTEPGWQAYPKSPNAPSGAPNVLLILADDVGFGASSTFGGAVPTPTFDALAMQGLRYNAFHTTAMCSPTRAALLTGRNHHAVASGSIADVSLDDAGYTSVIPKSAGMISRVLKMNGYDTAFFGKNHNTPVWENGPLGPFDNWPNAWGFDYFYGFNAPYADQFNPALIENRNPVRPPSEPGYILDRDLADHAIHWINMQRNLHPDHPFFAYLATGSMHAPHMAPADWIARFKGRFDQGWDKLREETFARQKAMGIIPQSAVFNPRPDGVPAWDDLSPDMKRTYARMMEVAAAQLAYFDAQTGRIIEALRVSGQLDNTLVVYIQGDNGASMEDYRGSSQELLTIAGIETSDADMVHDAAQHGGPASFGNYPAGWAWATNAPFQWGKRVASHLGGLRDGMVISWPARIKQPGQIRGQFTHVTDIAPTIYEAAGIKAPTSIDGVRQQPIEGVSMVYTFDHADAATRHREQYFEMLGNRAYYKDGWMASTLPGNMPWTAAGAVDPGTFKWALYDLNKDWSQSRDVSTLFPGKLAELKADFDRAAKKYHVYPLDAKLMARMDPALRPSLIGNRTSFHYEPGDTRYPASSFPVTGPGWTISATVGVAGRREGGPILVQGDHFGGQALLLDDGRPAYIYNAGDGRNFVVLRGRQPLNAGTHRIEVRFAAAAGSTTLQLSVDGLQVDQAQTSLKVRGRGDAYVGRNSIAPFSYNPALPTIPASCDCNIQTLKIEMQSKVK
ncbi:MULTISPECIES: arylsulfatase [unclassified Novosphingobium]|uniref:arylsulfatase n=1 Tax=unclassified Novosphingobium TaxID=2644732 RepID=UPI000B0CB957|nr:MULTISPECIES: arylsulfatase [unclassified Novosphingobium]MDR6708636.1 arylsulfatase [Novosphingobium sp. 1748]